MLLITLHPPLPRFALIPPPLPFLLGILFGIITSLHTLGMSFEEPYPLATTTECEYLLHIDIGSTSLDNLRTSSTFMVILTDKGFKVFCTPVSYYPPVNKGIILVSPQTVTPAMVKIRAVSPATIAET